MGKRKLHTTAFYQCDWTGFPMHSSQCYMPVWSPGGKLLKKGCYCNWEAVVAHTKWQLERDEITPEEQQKVIEHIHGITGAEVKCAPHFDELLHTKGEMDLVEFHATCTKPHTDVTVVKIAMDGSLSEHITTGGSDLELLAERPRNFVGGMSVFHSTRKKGTRDLCVYYYPNSTHSGLANNTLASSIFKMQLQGDVILVQRSREWAYSIPRERKVTFTLEDYENQFNQNRKRRKTTSSSETLAPNEYGKLKEQMQNTLNAFEEEVSKAAKAPMALSTVKKSPKTDGHKLAQKYLERVSER